MPKPGGDPSSGISSGDVLIRTERHPACRRREARPGSCTDRENLRTVVPFGFESGMKGEAKPVDTARARVPMRCAGTEQPVVVLKAL